jgi:hypothetical protein
MRAVFLPKHKADPRLGISSMTVSPTVRRPIMGDVADPASVLYAPALVDLIGFEFVADKPRVRGGMLVTFRDERGALVTIRLSRSAAGSLFRALESGPAAPITNINLAELIDVQPTTLIEASTPYDPAESTPEKLRRDPRPGSLRS